ncbi:HET-domain-containing protein [Decorospora gaudefroyi]|uniref:HET-domain-containing protein n=1 Tax=Decorospora gaudefroyi TaxID=184978 RepID=A0A6A5K7F5_9PLEO|nr:HET-domain-containing protein [Decorospora gaudefroyi]
MAELRQCGTWCELCGYICTLFDFEDFAKRVADHDSAAHEKNPRAPRGQVTTVEVAQRIHPRWPDPDLDELLNRVTVSVFIQHGNTKIIDKRDFEVSTSAGRAFSRPIWKNTASTLTARSTTIRSWLSECQTHHPDCQKTLKPSTPLAARILAVEEAGPENFVIKLVSTEKINLHQEPYLVLSHVWGGIEIPCKTTSENISQYQNTGIDFHALPLTFQDAVRITIAIGFSYLWIDSLCIIQNSGPDWQCESAKMSAIFRAGTLTLSATTARNSQEGCGLQTASFERVTRFKGTQEGLSFAARQVDAYGRTGMQLLGEQMASAPVNERAWILQEKLLSRRILHATHLQFVWQCCMVTESEDGNVYHEKGSSLTTGWKLLHSHLPRDRGDASCRPRDAYAKDWRWWEWVQDYNRRTLKVPSDHYVAFAGAVRLWHEVTNDDPVVGLWRRYLTLHLSWDAFRRHKCDVLLPTPGTRRPSWTWMSYPHGSVDVWGPRLASPDLQKKDGMGIVYQAKVVAIQVQWSGQALTSDPSGSTIRIRGMCRRMAPPKPLRDGVLGPLHLDPDVSDRRDKYDTLALVAYVRPAVLKNHPPCVTILYLVIQPTDGDKYMRIGRMELSESLIMAEGDEYRPKGELKEINLV